MILSLSLWLFQIKNNHCSFQKISLHINIWKYLLQNLTVFQSGSGNQTFSDFSLRIFPKWKRNEFVIVLSRRWRCLDQLSWKQNQRSCKQQKKLKHFSLRSILLNVNYFLLKCRSLSLELVVWLTSLVSVKFWCSLCSDRWRLWVCLRSEASKRRAEGRWQLTENTSRKCCESKLLCLQLPKVSSPLLMVLFSYF